MMRELAGKVKNLDTGHWITIAVLILTGALQYGSTTAQIGELSRSQARTEASEIRLEQKVDGMVTDQAVFRATLAASQAKLDAHIDETQRHFQEMGKR
jgi:hypothetical protein